MQKSVLLFLFYFLLIFKLSAQTKSIINEVYIDKKLEEIRFNSKISDLEKEKALFDLKSESKKIGYQWGILKSGRRVIEIYEKQNKNKEIIKLATELKKIKAGAQADRTMANLYRSNALALGYLGFDEASLKDFKTAVTYAKKIDDPDIKNYTLALAYEHLTLYFDNKKLQNKSYKDSAINYYKKSLQAANLIKDGHAEITTENKYSLISFNNIRFAILYLEEADKPGNIQIAEEYLTESLDIVNKHQLVNADKIILLNQLSWLYFEKKEYEKTIEYAKSALDIEKKISYPGARVESFEFLASAYAEMEDSKNSKFYMDKYTFLKDSIRITEKNNADQIFNHLLTDSKTTEEKKSSVKIIITSVISLVLLLSVILYWKRKNKNIHQKYEELILKINSEGKQYDDTQNKTQSTTLINNLDKFEKSNQFLEQGITLTMLANQLNTTAGDLAEIIKTSKNKIFSNYIDGLKVSYILRKLVSDPAYREFKIDLLGEKCGYNSQKAFTASFKSETGVSPSYFIRNLKKDNFHL